MVEGVSNMLHNKSAWGIVAFFALMALMVPNAESRGLGMSGIFFAMVIAICVAVLVPLVFKLFGQRLEETGLTVKDLGGFMVGYSGSSQIVDADAMGLVPYGYDAELADDDEEDFEQVDQPVVDDIPVLIEPNGLQIAENFQPGVADACCKCISIFGKRRSGKSTLLAVYAEELGRYKFPFVFFDTEDEYESLADKRYLPFGALAGHLSMRDDLPDNVYFFPIDVEGAYNFGQTILDLGLQVIVNLKSFNDDDAAYLMHGIVHGIDDWQHARSTRQRVPAFVLLDEATKWMPQNQGEIKLSRQARAKIYDAFFDTVVRRGGKRGWGFITAFQKVAETDKRLLSADYKYAMRQTEKPDLDVCEWMGLDREEVMSLTPGEAFVFCPQVPGGMWIKVRESQSPHGGASPGLENLVTYRRHLPASMTGVLARMNQLPSRQIPATQMLEKETEIATEDDAHIEPLPAAAKRFNLQEAARLWNEEGASSVRLLQKAMGLDTYYQANQVYRQLKERRLIE